MVVEDDLVQLIYLQRANGTWDLNEDLANILGVNLEDMLTAHPAKHVDSSGWATLLAVVWLHTHGKDWETEWELLERKAVAWIHIQAGKSPLPGPFPTLPGRQHIPRHCPSRPGRG
ncbi:von Willebrand factor A domain-containing protein 5A [Sciurus carolinensis]|uniref:von Willebrand factor A domain-containing protein 5A n=1 Tax=Sciurus carolinensis TaxID=30640 RepID=A0AA41MV88_SCICA|nr:von Willebrand factor A domain-containing protein 5A [Sciurus carolinensis]